MKPGIFFDDFERTEFSDSYYGMLGRALVFATRYEKSCEAFAALIGFKGDPALLGSEEKRKEFFDKLQSKPLARQIQGFGISKTKLYTVLDSGRRSRNFVAHHAGVGLDQLLDDMPKSHLDQFVKTLGAEVREIAVADCLLCLLASLVTDELIPTKEFRDAYPSKIVEWVTDCEDVLG